jgi:hypothetical protein
MRASVEMHHPLFKGAVKTDPVCVWLPIPPYMLPSVALRTIDRYTEPTQAQSRGDSDVLAGDVVDRRNVVPDNVRDTLQTRLQDAEARTAQTQLLIDRQKKVINEMARQHREDLDVAREVLSTLVDTLHCNEAEVAPDHARPQFHQPNFTLRPRRRMDNEAVTEARQQVEDAKNRIRDARDPVLKKQWEAVAEMWEARLVALETQQGVAT